VHAVARRKRAMGVETLFLTGTDEHGQKIERSARPRVDSKPACRPDGGNLSRALDRMGSSTTTSSAPLRERHKRALQEIFRRMQKNDTSTKPLHRQYCVIR